MNIGLFFGSNTGNTDKSAEIISSNCDWASVDLFNIADTDIEEFDKYNFVIIGIPTADCGGIQSDWDEAWDALTSIDWSTKLVALYGLGDQFGYGEFFMDAMGLLHDHLYQRGANFIGYWPTTTYDFQASKATINDSNLFSGLALDEDNEDNLTENRIKQWLEQLKTELSISA